MNKKSNYEQIRQYKKGNLDATETRAFEQNLKQDTQLQEDTAFYETAEEAFQIRAMLKEVDASLSQNNFFEQKSAASIRSIQKTRTWQRTLSIAASFAVLLVMGGFLYSNINYSNERLSTLDLGTLGLETDNGIRSNDNTIDVFADGIEALNAQKYEEAIQFFAAIDSEANTYNEAKLYAAFSNYKLGNYKDAATDATAVSRRTQDAATKQKAEWLHLNALFNSNSSSEEFQQLLAKIANDNTHRFQKEALQLKVNLNSVWRKFSF